MDELDIKRLDHHGIVAGAFEALGLEPLLNEAVGTDAQERVSTGQAVKAMVLMGLGFTNRPVMLTPQFFETLPVEALIGPGVSAEHLNRHKLGRVLDALYEAGCATVFAGLAAQVCAREGVNTGKQSVDTTSFSLTGEYDQERDTEAVQVCHGYSKDHRPDLKQIVTELVVSQDGGVPLMLQCHDGNASDSKVFAERSKAVLEQLQASSELKAWVGDSKLYSKDNAQALAHLPFITRVPRTVKQEQELVSKALAQPDDFAPLSEDEPRYRYQRFELEHYGIAQRWLVVFSQAARERAEATVAKQVDKEADALEKALFHLQAQRFGCRTDAEQALTQLGKGLKYHRLSEPTWQAHPKYAGRGRPSAKKAPERVEVQLSAQATRDETAITARLDEKACFVLATRISTKAMSDAEVVRTYKAQSSVEGGFRFLKSPDFFATSLFVKKPERMEALVMVMTLALLVYAVAQRHLRQCMAEREETLPNQIGKPDKRPTLRWVFQCFEGISLVSLSGQTHIHGLNELHRKTLSFFQWLPLLKLYQISPDSG